MVSNPKRSSIIGVYLLTLFTLFSSLVLIQGYNSVASISTWCSTTPYPNQCEFHLNNNQYNSLAIRQKSDFLNIIIQSVLEFVQRAYENAHYSQGSNYMNKREKAAWKDCLDLYDLTIQHLKETMNNTGCTQADAQTWLSSALTLFQTCQDGFTDDLGGIITTESTNPNYNMLSNNENVSCLISNALAINGQGSSSSSEFRVFETEDGFPKWVRSGDRMLLQSSGANLVVAQDGSGDYRTVGEAVSATASKRSGDERFVIYIKTGIYEENVKIGSNLRNIMLLGDGINKTIITGSKSKGGGSTTFDSATVAVDGSGFSAQGITIRNTAGQENEQAVALRSTGDLSVFYKCSFEGYQDTLYTLSNRQFYRECDIYGTVDFIFGNAAVVLQNCNIYVRYPVNKTAVITAQGRTDPNQTTGISIHNSNINFAQDLKGLKSYLGRPWKMYSRTLFIKTYMSNIIDPEGWLKWNGKFALDTLYYGEYANTGPGASTSNRVKWPGYHEMNTSAEVANFSVSNFITGNSWLPNTGVPFKSEI